MRHNPTLRRALREREKGKQMKYCMGNISKKGKISHSNVTKMENKNYPKAESY